jgi:cell division protein FtsB
VKLLAVVLVGLLALIQYPLWLGHGSWLRVWELDRQLGLQQEVNAGKRMRNEGLEAEASDLRNGTLAIEERARYELGMVKQDEIFVQLNSSGGGAAPRPGSSPMVPGPAPGASTSGSIDPADVPLEAPRRRAGGVVTVGR